MIVGSSTAQYAFLLWPLDYFFASDYVIDFPNGLKQSWKDCKTTKMPIHQVTISEVASNIVSYIDNCIIGLVFCDNLLSFKEEIVEWIEINITSCGCCS